jgi:type I restriction enzyme, S subunit
MKQSSIPSHWSWKMLDELGSPKRPAVKAGPFGSSLKKEYYVESGFRVYGQEQVIAGTLSIGDYYIDKDKFESLKSCEVKAGDILISLVGTFGKVLVVPEIFEPGIINPRLVRLSLNPSIINPYFFCHYFQSPLAQHQMKLKSHGGTMDILNTKNISELLVPLPPLEEQHRIAAILDKASAIRSKRFEAIRLTEELLRAVFLDMFGDPVTNPKGWEVRQLDEVAAIQSGVTKGRKLDQSRIVSVPYMRVANVQDGYLDLNEIKEIEVLSAEVEKYTLKKGDLLLTEGGDPDKLGRGSVWYEQIPICIHQNHIFRVRSNQALVKPEFLSILIGSERGKKYFLRAAKQTTGIATINMTQLRAFPALLPPLTLQKEYINLVEKQRFMLNHANSHFKEINNLFNSLLHRAFRGEL